MPKRGCITTYSGRTFNLLDPTAEMICIEDIAHHLSMVCRWAGATRQFYSVAQHSVLVSKIVPPYLIKWALMHDAAEAYIGDITRPLKALLPDVRSIEYNIMEVIALTFELGWPEPPELAHYDDQMIKVESMRYLQQHDGQFQSRHAGVGDLADLNAAQVIPPILLEPCLPVDAETMFLARYRKVFLDDDGL